MTKKKFILEPTKFLGFYSVIVDNYTLKEIMISDNIKVERVEKRPLEDWDRDFKFYGYKIIVDFTIEDKYVETYKDNKNTPEGVYVISMNYENSAGVHEEWLHLTQNKTDTCWWNSKFVKTNMAKKVR